MRRMSMSDLGFTLIQRPDWFSLAFYMGLLR